MPTRSIARALGGGVGGIRSLVLPLTADPGWEVGTGVGTSDSESEIRARVAGGWMSLCSVRAHRARMRHLGGRFVIGQIQGRSVGSRGEHGVFLVRGIQMRHLDVVVFDVLLLRGVPAGHGGEAVLIDRFAASADVKLGEAGRFAVGWGGVGGVVGGLVAHVWGGVEEGGGAGAVATGAAGATAAAAEAAVGGEGEDDDGDDYADDGGPSGERELRFDTGGKEEGVAYLQ